MVSELPYQIREWREPDGRRHVCLKVNLLVKPYVRQTRTTRWRSDAHGQRAQEYNEAQAAIRDAVTLIMLKKHIEPLKGPKLGFQADFWLLPKKVFRNVKHTWVDDPKKVDLGNLEKGLEDSLQGALYKNDVRIWRRGQGGKHLGEDDWFFVHVWELPEGDLKVEEMDVALAS